MTPFHFGLLVLICAVWGFHFTVIKATIAEVPVFFYIAIRMACVALLLLPLLKWHRGQMARIVTAGCAFGALNYAFMFSGVHLTTASIGAVLIETYMPIAAILSVLILKERIGWKRITGLVLAFAGVIIIVSGGNDATGARNLPLGALLILCGATCEAIGAIIIKKITGVTALQLLAWFGVIGMSITTVLTILFERGQWQAVTGDSRILIWSAIAYSVLMASIFGHATYYWLLQRVDVSQVAGATMMTTIFAVGFGVWLMNDPLTVRFMIGGLVTMIGVAIIVLRSRVKSPPIAEVLVEGEGHAS